MKKRWILCFSLGLAVAAVAVMVEPTHVVRGWLRGERFFAGRPSSYWSKVIRDRQPVGRFEDAIGLVLGKEPNPAAVPMLVELLEDEDDEVRFAACHALAANGSAARQAVPALLEMLGHPNLFYRRNASHALAAIGPDDSAIDMLNEALKEDDSWVNYYAAIAVGKLGPQGKPAVPALLDLITSEKATKEVAPNIPVDFQVKKLGEHTVVELKPGVPRRPSTGTVGYAAWWALLQIDPEQAEAADPR
jgi:hypothetical protein